MTTTATGLTLIVLIVLCVGTQLASSLMMQAQTMDLTRRRMTLLLPLFFAIFIVSFPAGLILYWITTNTWTIAPQWVIRRRIGPVVPVTPAASTALSGGDNGGRAPATPNGGGSGGGMSGLLRSRTKPNDKQPAVGASARPRREASPPRTPDKTKKRSGRRR